MDGSSIAMVMPDIITALKSKRAESATPTIDIKKMAAYFDTDEETLRTVIARFEKDECINTHFVII